MQQLLPWLCMLACPVGMGIMWWIGRDKNAQGQSQFPDTPSSSVRNELNDQLVNTSNPDERMALLKARLSLMQNQQASLTEQIERMSSENEALPDMCEEAAARKQSEAVNH